MRSTYPSYQSLRKLKPLVGLSALLALCLAVGSNGKKVETEDSDDTQDTQDTGPTSLLADILVLLDGQPSPETTVLQGGKAERWLTGDDGHVSFEIDLAFEKGEIL